MLPVPAVISPDMVAPVAVNTPADVTLNLSVMLNPLVPKYAAPVEELPIVELTLYMESVPIVQPAILPELQYIPPLVVTPNTFFTVIAHVLDPLDPPIAVEEVTPLGVNTIEELLGESLE